MKKFTESLEIMSSDKIDELLNVLDDDKINLGYMSESYEKIIEDINKFRDLKSDRGDQLDESVVNLQLAVSDINSSISRINVIYDLLEDYKSSGRKFIF